MTNKNINYSKNIEIDDKKNQNDDNKFKMVIKKAKITTKKDSKRRNKFKMTINKSKVKKKIQNDEKKFKTMKKDSERR